MNHYFATVLTEETGFKFRSTYTNCFESDYFAVTYYESIYGDRLLSVLKVREDKPPKAILSLVLSRT